MQKEQLVRLHHRERHPIYCVSVELAIPDTEPGKYCKDRKCDRDDDESHRTAIPEQKRKSFLNGISHFYAAISPWLLRCDRERVQRGMKVVGKQSTDHV